MNWRNPFLTGYLAVTVVGAGILGYLVYSSYTHYSEVSEQYDTQVARLQSLQNRSPFPNEENNRAYARMTAEYRGEYDRLLAQIAKMQKPLDASLTPQAFQDRLRAYVSEVQAAAKQNGVELNEGFYLGFDQYQGSLPSNDAAAPLGRELEAIRLVVDRLVEFKVAKVLGIKRDALPEEGGAPRVETPAPGGNRRPSANGPKVVVSNDFDIAFVADQSRVRLALNAIATASQFFVIRNLTIDNSNSEGPSRVDAAADVGGSAPASGANPGEASPGAAPAGSSMRLLVGRESLTVATRIEMITFNPPDSKK